jgi:NADH-quinone oxidoreductase subunit M
MNGIPILTTLMVVPLLGALALWLVKPLRSVARPFALAVALVELALGVIAVTGFDTAAAGTYQLVEHAAWIPAFGISYALGVNGLGLLMILLSLLLVPLVILAAWRDHGERLYAYLALILLLEVFMVGIFAARDLFLFYVIFEAMLIPVYFMIGSFGRGERRRYAAIKFLLYSLAGGLIMLAGVIYLYILGPRGDEGFLIDNLTGLGLDPTTERWLFISFFIAFAVKAPMFPVHTWLPDAAEHAPAGTSVLLVGVLDKVGTFGMVALLLPLFPNASVWAAPFVCALAVISILYGAILALGQEDLMRLVSYTSVSHFGFIILGIFAFTTTSTTGASFYMFNHGLSTGGLFLLGGMLAARGGGSQRIDDFTGLVKPTPMLAGFFLIVGLSALGLPGLSPFVSEFLVLVGSFGTQPSLTVLGTLGVVLAALYILWTVQRIFTGPVPDELADTPDLDIRERGVIAPLIAIMLVFGFYPEPALELVREPAQLTVAEVAQVPNAVVIASGDEGSAS